MWWEKKGRQGVPQDPMPVAVSHETPETSVAELTSRIVEMPTAIQSQTVVGRSMVLRGDLSGKEDLLIEGQFEGTISLPEHCVTIGANGEVKAEVHARQVVILGSVTGNISARERIEIRKSGQVVGDLVAAGIAIEDGAFFKGSIDIVREQGSGAGASLDDQAASKVGS